MLVRKGFGLKAIAIGGLAILIAAMPVAAMALATCTIALCAAGILPWATICHVWNGVPIATVGACA